VWAQSEAAALRGVVTDSSGAAAGAVTLIITEMGTEISREASASDKGVYAAPYLKPGRYRVTIDQRGFRAFVANGIELRAGEVRRFDPVLTPGGLDETQEIDEAGKVVLSERGTVSGLIDYRARQDDAPVVDRRGSPMPLLVTAPAVQGNGRSVVISGQGRTGQTWAVDGMPHDTVNHTANPNYFDSVNVTVANPSVIAYRPGGFDMVSRRGLDTWHGSAYYRHGSSALDARPYFDAAKTPYRLQEAGGEMGGALIPKRTFVYGGWTYQRDFRSETLYADVPTAKMRTGNFSELSGVIRDPRNGVPFPTNQIPGSRLSSVSNNLLTNYYPSPVNEQLTQNYSWNHPFGRDPFLRHWPFVRVDQKLSDTNTLYLRFLQIGATSIFPGSAGPALNSTQRDRLRSWVLSDTQAVSSNLVNKARFGWIANHLRQGQEERDVTPLHGDSVVGGIALQGVNPTGLSAAGFPAISIAGFTGLSMQAAGGSADDIAQNHRVWTFDDSLAWTRGRHTVQFGGQYLSMRWMDGTVPQNVYGAFTFTGAFSANALADFLLGLPATSTRSHPKVNRPLVQDQAGLFAVDSFRATRRLTVEYGIRWDYFGAASYEDGYMSSWDRGTGAVIVAPGTLTSVSKLYPASIRVVTGEVVPKANFHNFRPRVSAAYRLRDNLVLRGGYGEFTAAAGYGTDGFLSPTNPYWPTETYTNSITSGTAAISFPRPFPVTPTSSQLPSQTVTALPARLDEGVIRQYNATLERTFRGAAVRLSYIGARGSAMNYTLDINKPQASAIPFANSRKPYPQFAATRETRTDGRWRYDAAQVEVRRTAGPVTFDSNFTWSNNFANYLNTNDPYRVTESWNRDSADRRLYFTTAAAWRLPVGKGSRWFGDWTLHAIATAASGQFYTPVFTGPDPANASAGFVTQPADCIGDPDAGARTISRWFNPSAFAVPPAAAGRYGTCGVNSLEGYPIRVGHLSLAKQIPFSEWVRAVFTAQVSNVGNRPHFTVPNSNISTLSAGAFTASSAVDPYSPERQNYRQVHLKLRFEF
jgi:hypothetical protein